MSKEGRYSKRPENADRISRVCDRCGEMAELVPSMRMHPSCFAGARRMAEEKCRPTGEDINEWMLRAWPPLHATESRGR